ncbi:2307_t:CDS:2, partial [Paraglomus occultum]
DNKESNSPLEKAGVEESHKRLAAILWEKNALENVQRIMKSKLYDD